MPHFIHRLSSFQLISLGFAGLILAGSLFLMLPWATVDAGSAGFLDSLFTATSAVCVTGLIVHDTATYWTTFGQFIILTLIQLGGIGVVMVAIGLSILRGKQIGLRQRFLMQDSVAATSMDGIIRLTIFILKGFLIFEMSGAVLLFISWWGQMPLGQQIWYSIFHSISAFCNAGFDLMGINTPYSSLTAFSDHALINITIMLLIVIGGIGFVTWKDIWAYKLKFRRYKLQTKVILLTSLILIIVPALLLFFLEITDGPLKERILASLFQSVTTRTAGFNTWDLTSISESGQLMMILLMLIGGSPGSTAGGMKTTTFAILIFTTWAVIRKGPETVIKGRRIKMDQVRSAFTLLSIYLTLFLLGGVIISRVEGIGLLTCLFETASAIGTVGLTLGITPNLGTVSKIVLILLMYLGRVGGMTIFFAVIPTEHHSARFPVESISVG